MDSTEGWSIDADLGIAPLEARGWTVDQVPWRTPKVDWNVFDAVYIGTPWDDWHTHLEKGALAGFFDRIGKDSLIIKPVVSTNATDTHLLTRESASSEEPALLQTFRNRAFVVQPFIDNIQTEGEYSLFYFGGCFSHAIRNGAKGEWFPRPGRTWRRDRGGHPAW